jgi:hypothetical protein
MKKLIIPTMVMAVMLLVAALAHAQAPAIDLKPTFISPTPGLYVNGWPAFTVSYPKEWGELLPGPGTVLEVAGTRPGLSPSPVLSILVFRWDPPVEDWAKMFMPVWVNIWTDIKVLSEKPSRLKDGTPAREVEFEFVRKMDALMNSVKNAPKHNGVLLATKKDVAWVAIMLTDDRGKLGEDLRGIVYSLTFQPGREEPVEVPPDVRAFLDMYCTDIMSHDLKTVMAHYSDRFLFSGMGKPSIEQAIRNDPGFQRGTISLEATATVFEPHGDRAYVDGFISEKAKGDTNALKVPMEFQQIINEHGEWKWFGNQK